MNNNNKQSQGNNANNVVNENVNQNSNTQNNSNTVQSQTANNIQYAKKVINIENNSNLKLIHNSYDYGKKKNQE